MCDVENSQKDDCDSTTFDEIFYLGCASVNAPRSQTETLRLMSILRSPNKEVNNDNSNNAQSDIPVIASCGQQIKISLSVPNNADGIVR